MATESADEVLAVIVKCIDFAAVKHKNQRRKDPEKTPYINHPIGKEYFYREMYEIIYYYRLCN